MRSEKQRGRPGCAKVGVCTVKPPKTTSGSGTQLCMVPPFPWEPPTPPPCTGASFPTSCLLVSSGVPRTQRRGKIINKYLLNHLKRKGGRKRSLWRRMASRRSFLRARFEERDWLIWAFFFSCTFYLAVKKETNIANASPHPQKEKKEKERKKKINQSINLGTILPPNSDTL